MSSSFLPPVFRGKIPTTPGRFLIAAAVMFLLDLPLLGRLGAGVFPFHFTQVMVMIGVLLLASRRWMASILLLAVSAAYIVWHDILADKHSLVAAAFALVPLWVGTIAAYPHPWRRTVYVEDDEEDEEEES